jgi:ketosteroid isomerase-like protein
VNSVEVVLEAFAAVEARDERRLAAICDPLVSFHWPPSLPYGGCVTGRATTSRERGWSATWDPLQPTAAERAMDPRVVAATEAEVVVLWHQRGRAANGSTLDSEVLGLYQVRGGKLARGQMFYFDPAGVERFLRAHSATRSPHPVSPH